MRSSRPETLGAPFRTALPLSITLYRSEPPSHLSALLAEEAEPFCFKLKKLCLL